MHATMSGHLLSQRKAHSVGAYLELHVITLYPYLRGLRPPLHYLGQRNGDMVVFFTSLFLLIFGEYFDSRPFAHLESKSLTDLVLPRHVSARGRRLR